MRCPKCQTELIQGKIKKQKDGTEYFKLKCPKCESTFMDLKIPKSAFVSDEYDFEGSGENSN